MNCGASGLQNADLVTTLLQMEQGTGIRPIRKKRNATLFKIGTKPTNLYYLLTGVVRLERSTPSGHTSILQRLTGGFVAEPSVTANQYLCDGKCETDCELYLFPLGTVRQAIDQDANFRWAWIASLGDQARRQKARAERMSLKTVRAKLCHLIAAEGDREGRFRMTGTQAELASDLGITPEALYRSLSRLQAEGILSVTGAILQLTCMQSTSRCPQSACSGIQ
jgi:CRP-like cAMP-binding protein